MLALGFGAGWHAGSSHRCADASVTVTLHDTVTIRDTVIVNPVARSIHQLAARSVSLPVVRSATHLPGQNPDSAATHASAGCGVALLSPAGDSVLLVPEVRVYSDSTYRAVVSGINPSLDTLQIYARRRAVTLTRHLPVASTAVTDAGSSPSSRRWGLGVTAGISATPRGFCPGITLGLTYRLL